ncbi:MAG: hypothetical protein WEC59_11925 [Salibacteraceae bacterium]
MKKLSFILIISILWVFAPGCDESGKSTSQNDNKAQDSATKKPTSKKDSVRVMTLPTPMQIPALLKNSDLHYAPDMMLPIKSFQKTFFKSSVVFGAYLMDMSYAAAYGNHQASLDYFEACNDIGNNLGLGATMTEGLAKRFKRNLDRPDSLGRLILAVYDNGHKLLIHKEKEGIGLLMVMGCYIEGLHFTLNKARQNDLILFIHLLHQHKMYGQNLTWMLDQYEIPDEVKNEFMRFEKVAKILSKMDIPTVYALKSGSRSVNSINTEDLDLISEEVKMFRENVIQ